MNNIRKATFCSLIAVMTITMITSNQLSTYASPTTEDDGWTEGDYEGSPEEPEEQAQEDWEDAGRPGDNDNDDDDDDNDVPNPYCDTFPNGAAPIGESCHDRYDIDEETGLATCNDGTHKADPKDCKDVTKKPLPYCDAPAGKAASSCHDRLDYDDVTGLAPCNDGTQKADYHDCKDATKKNNDNDNGGSDKIIVVDKPQPQKTLTLSIESCKDIGTSDGKELKFNAEIYKICNDTHHNDDIDSGLSTRENTYYYFDFIGGCEQAGWSTHDCVKAVKVN